MSTKKRVRKGTMKQITRHQAEALFHTSQVITTNVIQNKKEMQVLMTLSDHRAFLLKYNLNDHVKSYFLEDVK